MIVLNLTRKTKITNNLQAVNSLSDKAFGLLKRSNSKFLLFQTRFGIHTFGLNKPIDILILDDKLKVVKTGFGVKPNRLFFWHPKYFLVLELPSGVIINSRTKKGDQLSLN